MTNGPFRVPVLQRTCGDCNACCTFLAVVELGKEPLVRCSHLVDGTRGCSVYEERPDSCREFRCLWHQGAVGHKDRPDKIGVMLDVTYNEDERTGEVQQGKHGVIAFEIEEGGFEKARARLAEFAGSVSSFLVRRLDGTVLRFNGRELLPMNEKFVEKRTTRPT